MCFSCFGIPVFYVYMLWTFYVRFTYPYHGYGTKYHIWHLYLTRIYKEYSLLKSIWHYTDDIAILANTPDQAETLLHSLERAAAGIGLYVNAHKTEYM